MEIYMIKCFARLNFKIDVRVHSVPVVLRSVFISEQLQVDGLRSSLHAPVLEKNSNEKTKKYFKRCTAK